VYLFFFTTIDALRIPPMYLRSSPGGSVIPDDGCMPCRGSRRAGNPIRVVTDLPQSAVEVRPSSVNRVEYGRRHGRALCAATDLDGMSSKRRALRSITVA